MAVDKNKLLYRGEDGKLLPVEVEVEYSGGSVWVRPMSRGYWLSLNVRTGQAKTEDEVQALDDQLVLDHLVEPVLSLEDLKSLPSFAVRELVVAIILVSGGRKKSAEKDGARAMSEVEEEFKKKTS